MKLKLFCSRLAWICQDTERLMILALVDLDLLDLNRVLLFCNSWGDQLLHRLSPGSNGG